MQENQGTPGIAMRCCLRGSEVFDTFKCGVDMSGGLSYVMFGAADTVERPRIITHERKCFDVRAHGGLSLAPRVTASYFAVSYTHLRAHETVLDLVCRLLLEKTKNS